MNQGLGVLMLWMLTLLMQQQQQRQGVGMLCRALTLPSSSSGSRRVLGAAWLAGSSRPPLRVMLQARVCRGQVFLRRQ
jgi:hypothetical protein